MNQNDDKTLALILIASLVILLCYFGEWEGQMLSRLTQLQAADKNNTVFFLAFGSTAVLAIGLLRKKLRIHFPYRGILALFILSLLVASFFRPDLVKSLRNFSAILFTYGITFFLASLIHSLRLKSALKILSVVFLAALAASAIVHKLRVGPIVFFAHEDLIYRLGGLFPFSHFGAIAGLLGLICLVLLSKNDSWLWKTYYCAALCASIIFIAFSDVRSAFVAMVASGAYLAFIRTNARQKLIKNIIPIVLILATAVYLFFSYYIPDTVGGQTIKENFHFRVEIWKLSMAGIKESPLFGHGSESYLAGSIDAQAISKGMTDPHNALLGLVLQSGIIAAMFFIILYSKICLDNIRGTLDKSLFAIAIYWAVFAFFWGDTFLGTAGFLQIIFGLSFIGIMLHGDIYEKKKNTEGNPQDKHHYSLL